MLQLSKELILGSNSPRRREILQASGFPFSVQVRSTNEQWPAALLSNKVAGYLAQQKAEAFSDIHHQLVLTADTIVVVDQQILNKPKNIAEATTMLQSLSGRSHSVYTGICLKDGNTYTTLTDHTQVAFNPLSLPEIQYYINNCQPFDKAGAYGVQDFIGMVGVHHLSGSFYNVMGLPIHLAYQLLKPYLLLV
jgi:septum formation protein